MKDWSAEQTSKLVRTSIHNLTTSFSFNLGEWVLVTASAGGVGMAAVQIAKGKRKPFTSRHYRSQSITALGAKVIAAAGSDAKLEVSKKFGGADYAVDYTKPDWQKEVLKITGGKGVDVIYDPVGLIKGAHSPVVNSWSNTEV